MLCANTYTAKLLGSDTLSINRTIHIHGLLEVENGFWHETAFVLTANDFLKLSVVHSTGVLSLSKLSLGNFKTHFEYLS